GALAAPLAGQAAAGQADGVQTLCSGLGLEEQAEADAGGFSLKAVGAEAATGAYVGDISVRVLQGDRVVAGADCEGPWFLAHLPAGRYVVEMAYQGQIKRQSVSVPREGRREVTFGF
ncbi:MAG: hypothetical protein AAF074_24485, partial [Pseudomonadota bacterium]